MTGRSRAALGLLGPQRSEGVETPHAERHHSEMKKKLSLRIVFLGTVKAFVLDGMSPRASLGSDGNMMTKFNALSLLHDDLPCENCCVVLTGNNPIRH